MECVSSAGGIPEYCGVFQPPTTSNNIIALLGTFPVHERQTDGLILGQMIDLNQ